MDKPVAWLNGNVIPFDEMSVPVWDMGVVAGASITEMARTYRHRPFRLAEHLDRLLESCQELQFETPWSKDKLFAAAHSIVHDNSSLIADTDDLGIVIFITAGSNPTYLGGGPLPGPTVGIHTFRLPFELWKPAASDGVRLSVPAARQISSNCLPIHRKTRNRMHWWLADRQADAMESGSRALLLDDDGRLTETSTACFYAVINDCIVTPRQNVLNSMSRRMVKELTSKCNVAFEERDLTMDAISEFQEAFVSSTPIGILKVQSINGIDLKNRTKPSVVPELLTGWQQLTGLNPTEQILRAT